MSSADLQARLSRMDRKIDQLTNLVKELSGINNKAEWIPEQEAAGMLHWSKRWLRKQAKSGEVPILYRHFRNRNFEYRLKDIKKFKKSL